MKTVKITALLIAFSITCWLFSWVYMPNEQGADGFIYGVIASSLLFIAVALVGLILIIVKYDKRS
jgi:uncharacterized membrane protein